MQFELSNENWVAADWMSGQNLPGSELAEAEVRSEQGRHRGRYNANLTNSVLQFFTRKFTPEEF